MGKFNSSWIERNVYYRPKPNTDGVPHFEAYDRPHIVCLCGSTRFKSAWYEQTKKLTHDGLIVLGVGDLDTNAPDTNVPIDEELKTRLDELHKRKIDLADFVLVLNCLRGWCLNHQRWTDQTGPDMEYCCSNVEMRGYIGESTRSEVQYAIKNHKPVVWLTPSIPEEFKA